MNLFQLPLWFKVFAAIWFLIVLPILVRYELKHPGRGWNHFRVRVWGRIFYRRIGFGKAYMIPDACPWWMGEAWTHEVRLDIVVMMLPFNRIASVLRSLYYWLRGSAVDTNKLRSFSARLAHFESWVSRLDRDLHEAKERRKWDAIGAAMNTPRPVMSNEMVDNLVRYELALRRLSIGGCQSPITELGTDTAGGPGQTYTCLEAMGKSILQHSPRMRIVVEEPCYACLATQALRGV